MTQYFYTYDQCEYDKKVLARTDGYTLLKNKKEGGIKGYAREIEIKFTKIQSESDPLLNFRH